MPEDKIRLFALAKSLGVEPKWLLDLCQRSGIGARNMLSELDSEQQHAIQELLNRGGDDPPSITL